MPKHSVMFASFPYHREQDPDVSDWLLETIIKARSDPRLDRIVSQRYDNTPITMTRNEAVKDALKAEVDFICMIDNDMKPDAYLQSNNNKMGVDPTAKPFWESSLDFLLAHYEQPSMICAPYCGPPPHENIYVFQWANLQSDHPNSDLQLNQYSREDAARRAGIEEVAALPTGLVLIDMRCFNGHKPPYFYYEWQDEYEAGKASTEDVTFSRDMSLASKLAGPGGGVVYCNWDAWAGHWKRKCVGKPQLLSVDSVRASFVDAVRRNHKADECMTDVHMSPMAKRMVANAARRSTKEIPHGQETQVAVACDAPRSEAAAEAVAGNGW